MVIVLPAPIVAPLPILTGATSEASNYEVRHVLLPTDSDRRVRAEGPAALGY